MDMLQWISIIHKDGGLFIINIDSHEFVFGGVHEKSNLYSLLLQSNLLHLMQHFKRRIDIEHRLPVDHSIELNRCELRVGTSTLSR